MRGKLLLSLGSLVLLFLLLEGAVRVRSYLRHGVTDPHFVDNLVEVDPELRLRVLKPGFQHRSGQTDIRINSLGFRGEEFSRTKGERTLRIACLGASTTFCSEASSNAATWPARLEEFARELYPGVDIEVINAAVPGYTAGYSLANLRHRVLPLDPDLVLVYHANNDLAAITGELAEAAGVVTSRSQRAPAGLRFLTRHSMLADLVWKNLRILGSMKEGADGKLAALPPDLADRFVDKLAQMHDELSAHGIPMVLSEFVVKYRADQPREEQLANANVAFYYMPWMTMDQLLQGMEQFNQAIVELAEARGIPVIRDQTSIPADDAHFADCMHLTDQGCVAMARRFLTFLEQEGILTAALERRGLIPGR